MARKAHAPIHPGEVLEEEFLAPLEITQYFGTSERFWMNLQTRYDLEVEKERLKGRLAKEVSVLREAS